MDLPGRVLKAWKQSFNICTGVCESVTHLSTYVYVYMHMHECVCHQVAPNVLLPQLSPRETCMPALWGDTSAPLV